MKGNKKLIAALNKLLADELSAINQYMVHSEMCENWGYGKLHKAIEKQAVEEMHHAEWLIQRILFFEGRPTVSNLNPMTIGKNVLEIINNDYQLELGAVHSYNETVKISREVEDKGTDDLLTKILKDEEKHVDWAEMQISQIEQMGMTTYLVNQTEGAAG
jgi:bacterioferritin